MSFYADSNDLIIHLESENIGHKDQAINRVVEILKQIENIKELKKQKSLINRIAVDGIERLDLAAIVVEFTNKHTKQC
jgi:hypothetical protein